MHVQNVHVINYHSYTNLMLALGIVREPTIWGLLLQNIYLTRNECQKGREWRGSSRDEGGRLGVTSLSDPAPALELVVAFP